MLSACAPAHGERREPARTRLALLHVADLHSHLFPERVTLDATDAERGLGGASGDTVSVGGAARIATALDRERARTDVAVTLDAGDVFEGTAVYTLFGGVPEMRVVDALGVDAQALGNHDFSPGPARLASLRRYAPGDLLLAANLGAEAAGLAEPSVLVERGGLRVRIVGVGRSPDAAPDVAASAAVVQQVVDASRDADVIVVLSHLGTDLDDELVPLTTGVDVVLGGHTHDVTAPQHAVQDCGAKLAKSRGCRSRVVPVVHSGAYGRYVGRVSVLVSTEPQDVAGSGRRSAVVEVRPSLVPITAGVVERPDVLTLLEPYRRAMATAGLGRPIAFAPRGVSRAAVRGGDSALGDFVTHALRVTAGAELALINTTGIRDDLPAGELTVEDVFRVLPFDDRLVRVHVSGRQLLDVVEHIRSDSCGRGRTTQAEVDGGTFVLGCGGAGSAEVRVAGHPVNMSGAYAVATASFLTGAGQWLGHIDEANTEDLGLLRDAVLGVLAELPPCGGDAGSILPCLDALAGAGHDGRITWR